MASDIKMDYNFLGKSGIKVSNICLGAMTFGTSNEGPMSLFFNNPKQTDEATSHKILDRFVQLGGNFIDTANIYSYGNSEKIIGTWLTKQKRDDIVVATKVRMPMDMKGLNNAGLSRRHILKSCDDSLERLQTNYIDLYQAHMWDNATPIEETLRTFDDLIRCGKIRYYGYSNVCGWQLQKIVDTAKYLGLNPCISLQQQYNLLRRDSELEAFIVCENEGIAVLPWSPLKGGMLTGKFKRDEVPDPKGSRAGYMRALKEEGKMNLSNWDEYKNDENFWQLIEIMEKIAKVHGKSVPQVALRWLLQKTVVASVIIGATSIAQLEDNAGASAGWELTNDEMAELDKTSPRSVPYPFDMIWGMANTSRFNRFNHSIKI